VAKVEIITYGNPILRKKCKSVGKITPPVRSLIANLTEAMREANGLGLAAPQIGVLQRVVVVGTEEEPIILINPRIVGKQGEQVGLEGCLSFPKLYGDVRRPEKITVKARNKSGHPMTITGEGLLARALVHEIAHLRGDLFVNHVEAGTLHWATGETDENGELKREYTTLEQALAVLEGKVLL